MSEIGRLATEIVDDELSFLTGTDRDVAISRASGWLLNNEGQLNNVIFTSYSGENPGFKYEESSIYKMIYLNNYYRSKAGAVLKNMDSSTLQWLSLREGDSQVQLQNKNEVAKTYTQIAKQTKEDVDKLIWAYNLFQAYPRQVYVSYDEAEVAQDGTQSVDVDIYTVNGYIDIPIGQNYVDVTFDDLGHIPERISLALIKPSGGSNVSYSVVGTTITQTGFRVAMGATINITGYQINYGVK